MKALVVDDDFTNRMILQESLRSYGDIHVAADGREAVAAARYALDSGEPYNLICLDIMMPSMNGHEALRAIREMEEEHGFLVGDGATVVMTTALDDPASFRTALKGQCDYYLVKPIDMEKLTDCMRTANLIH